MTSAEQY